MRGFNYNKEMRFWLAVLYFFHSVWINKICMHSFWSFIEHPLFTQMIYLIWVCFCCLFKVTQCYSLEIEYNFGIKILFLTVLLNE